MYYYCYLMEGYGRWRIMEDFLIIFSKYTSLIEEIIRKSSISKKYINYISMFIFYKKVHMPVKFSRFLMTPNKTLVFVQSISKIFMFYLSEFILW